MKLSLLYRVLVVRMVTLTLLLVGFVRSEVYAQDFPVQSTVQLIPPNSLFLSDYSGLSTNGLQATILLKQADRFQFPVRLRLTIEGQELFMQTSETFRPQPIFLDGNIPVILFGADLAEYLNPQNLNISGNAARDVALGRALPEGLYTFTIEVLDFNRGTVISNAGRSRAWLVLNDPPILNQPAVGAKLESREPQNVFFQWTPRHTGSPNAAFNVRYLFELFEILPKGRNPNDIALTTQPVYEQELFSNVLVYGPGEPQLIQGRDYAWRVRALDESDRDLFKNNGFSEVFHFTYGDACLPPENISAQAVSHSKVMISWDQGPLQDAYKVRIKKTSDDQAEWFEYPSNSSSVDINLLEAETEYTYQVFGSCTGIFSEPSQEQTISTLPIEQFTCGEGEEVPFTPLDDGTLDRLGYGDVFTAAGFEVYVTEAVKENGTFSGTGVVELPFLKLVRVGAEFENIQINRAYQMVGDGVVKTTKRSVQELLDSRGVTGGDSTNTTPPDSTNVTPPDSTLIDSIKDLTGADSVIVVDGNLDTVYVRDGEIIAVVDGREESHGPVGGRDTDGDGVPDEDVAVTDEDGNTYVVDKNGNTGTPGNPPGGGGTDGTGGGTNGDGRTASSDLSSGQVDIGPAVVYFSEESPPTPTGDPDSDGYNSYENITTERIELTAVDGNIGTFSYTLAGASISFKQHNANGDFKEVAINWAKPEDENGYQFDQLVVLFSTFVEGATLTINAEGNVDGTLDLKPNLSEDQVINEVYVLKAQDYNNFQFSYTGENADGAFDLSAINNVSLDIVKSDDVVIASMTDGVLGATGSITGNFNMPNGPPPVFSNDQFTSTVNNVNLAVLYDPQTGLSLTGQIGMQLSNFAQPGPMTGTVDLVIEYEGGEAGTASNIEGDWKAFNMTLSNHNVNVIYDQKYDLTSISGDLDATHNDFISGSIHVNDFQYSQLNGLETFTASGDFEYNYEGPKNFTLQTSSVSTSDEALLLDAVILETAALPVEGFKIAYDGTITIQDVGEAGEADVVLGPIVVSFPSDRDYRSRNGGKLNGSKTRLITSRNDRANITLKTILPDGTEITRSLTGVDVTYRRFNERDNKALISGTINWTGDLEFDPIWGIATSLKNVSVGVNADGELLTQDEDGNPLGLTLGATLEEDKTIQNVFVLKSGLTGDISYKFAGENSFAGSFDLSGLQNINVSLEKDGNALAKIENGTFDEAGVFTGNFVKSQSNTFQSNAFNVSLDEININASYSFPTGDFTFNSGTAGLSVSNIQGFDEGSNLAFQLEYGADQNFTASVTSANLSTLGFSFNAENLVAEFSPQFDLTRFSGAISASHADLGANLNISQFLIEEGELKTLKIEGDVAYQGYNFTLSNTTYENDILNINANLALNLTGTSASFGVSDFKVAPDGVSLGGVSGSFSQGNVVDVNFSATFGESRFTGTFDADINALGLDVNGEIDIGQQNNDYYFAYLNLAAGLGVGVPLGPTGLKVTRLGGRLGFNYRLTYNQQASEFVGDPEQGNYVMGFTLGLADAAGAVEVVGSPIIQFSRSSFDFGLIGELSIPKNNPLLTSDLTLNYSYPAQTFAGSITTDVKVPQSSGSIFNANATLSFGVADNNWNLTGNPIQGSILSVVNFDGNFNFAGRVNPFRINTISLNGQANFDFNRSYTLDVSYLPFTITAGAEAHFNSYINATLNESGLNGEFGVNLSGRAYLQLRSTLYDFDLEAQITASGKVGYANGTGYVHGTVDIPVTVLTYNVNVPVKVDYNFDGNNSNNLVADGNGSSSSGGNSGGNSGGGNSGNSGGSNGNNGGSNDGGNNGGSDETFRERLVRLSYTDLLSKYDALANSKKTSFETDFSGESDAKLGEFNSKSIWVNSWDILDDAGASLKTNVDALKNITTLVTKQVSREQLVTIGQSNKSRIFQLAVVVARRSDFNSTVRSGIDAIALDANSVTQKSFANEIPNFLDDLTDLFRNPNLVNVIEVKAWLKDFKGKSNSGLELELQEALRLIGNGKRVRLGHNPNNSTGNSYDVDIYNVSDNVFVELKRAENGGGFIRNLGLIGLKFNSETKLPSSIRDASGRKLHGVVHVKSSSGFNGNYDRDDILYSILQYVQKTDAQSQSRIVGINRLSKLHVLIGNGIRYTYDRSEW